MKRINISNVAIIFGLFLSLVIALGTGISIKVSRDKAINDWRQQASNIALILAENTAQQMTTAYLALDDITERIKAKAPNDDKTLRALIGSEDFFQIMAAKAANSPQIDVATVVAQNGDVINFTRKWPAPKINLAERDYFKAHHDDAKLGVLVSDPVRNKGNGKWTFYISRRLNDTQGQFIGMVLLGISTDYYSDFYQRVSIAGKAVITLLRDDFTILARWPATEDLLGKKNLTGSSYLIVHDQKRSDGVLISDGPRLANNNASGQPRMGAVRTVKKYPLIVNYTIEEDIYLGAWRGTTRLILTVAAGSIIALCLAFTWLVRALRRNEEDLLLTKRLKHEAELANNEKTVLLENLSRNQQALTDSSEHMAAILDNAPDAILITDASGLIISCNRAAEQIFALPAQAINAHLIDTLILEIGQVALLDAKIKHEHIAKRANEIEFPCELSIASFQISGQQRQVIILRDISVRKKMEKAKTEFISTVSHELRTPLTAMRGSLGLLRGGVAGTLPKIGTDMLEMAYKNTEVLTRLINDLLDIQKMEAGQMEFNFSVIRLDDLLDYACKSNQAFASQFGVNILIDGIIPEVKLSLDEGRFQQIMANILSNACKFSPANSCVSVSAHQIDQQICISIRDQGQGIPLDFQDKMFQRFAQADSSDTRKVSGTGLGLSITRDLVTLMHGNIRYETSVGQGTCFFISFPIAT
ncbi:ATP-binding protein [Undibacterium parvum]|uniref:histidine kinase n=1 Tax=Undibacterium parvum TaxID=401471 RepID=A0A3Q9BRD4_9BURK|nr:ATP-binding protein [Undibacterium parvum]AZP12780.1 sensor histidine kinase [Undibacterium parvum]